jgi:hypothetical protein
MQGNIRRAASKCSPRRSVALAHSLIEFIAIINNQKCLEMSVSSTI